MSKKRPCQIINLCKPIQGERTEEPWRRSKARMDVKKLTWIHIVVSF
jgi:hypothetical protein